MVFPSSFFNYCDFNQSYSRSIQTQDRRPIVYLDQPSIELLGIRIDEPVNCATDLLVTVVCWYAWYRLRGGGAQPRAKRLMAYYFLVMGFATLLGGFLGHAFKYALAPEWKIAGWVVSMLSIMLIERAAIEYARPLIHPRVGQFFLWLNLAELVVLLALAVLFIEFNYVLGHSAYGLGAIVGGFHLFTFLKTNSAASRRMVQAVLIAGLGALFYINTWGVSPWFNHLDIGHTTMAIGGWFFYLGSKKLDEN